MPTMRTQIIIAVGALAAVALAFWTRPSAHVPMTDIWRLLEPPERR